MKNNLKNTTKTAIKTAALLLTLSGMGHGGTLDEVKSLWDPQGYLRCFICLPAGWRSARGDAGFSAPLVPAQQRQAGGPSGLESRAVHAGEVPVLP